MIRSLLRKLSLLILLPLMVIAIGRLWYLSKDGFNINRLHYPLPKSECTSECSIGEQLSGPYRYLGRGRQCYAFESSDGRYVLKIPRFDRYELPFFWKTMPSFFDSKKRGIFAGRQDRLTFTLESFRIAGTDLREETAVIYLHFHETDGLPKRLVLLDRLRRPYAIDPNRTAFVLQEKKELMMPIFLQALRDNDRAKAEGMLMAFLDILEARARLGILNRDPSFLKNFGWDGKKSIQIDIGSFWRQSEMSASDAYRVSLWEGAGRIKEWLAQIDPEMRQWFDQRLEEKLRKKG
jgi:hypothetical protein